MATEVPTPQIIPVQIDLRGGNLQAHRCKEPEFLLEGPAGTGKTFALLLRMHLNAANHPGYRGLIVRKELVNLGRTALRTLEENVYYQWDAQTKTAPLNHVRFFGGSQNEPASYVYENGSRIVIGGMDEPRKVLGSEYDEIYANEITELSEEDWQTLSSRLRHGVLTEMSMFGDCNPSYDRHWVLRRANAGGMKRFKTTLKDNPAFFDEQGNPTLAGTQYVAQLEKLTGNQRQRLLLGEWVGMENAIYADYLDASKHLLPIPEHVVFRGSGAMGVDYGRVHLSALTSATYGSDGHLWVRSCWAENGGGLQEIREAVRAHRAAYHVRYGVTDPIQEVLAQELGFRTAKSSAGSRKQRIEIVRGLLSADVLRFDKFGPGVQELWDELHMYRFEVRETDTTLDEVVVRKDDDRVASLEYMAECWNRYGPTIPTGQTPKVESFEEHRRRRRSQRDEGTDYNGRVMRS